MTPKSKHAGKRESLEAYMDRTSTLTPLQLRYAKQLLGIPVPPLCPSCGCVLPEGVTPSSLKSEGTR